MLVGKVTVKNLDQAMYKITGGLENNNNNNNKVIRRM